MFASFSLVSSLFLWSIAGISAAMEAPSGPRPRFSAAAQFPAIACGALILIAGLALAIQDAAWADLGRAVEAGDLAAARANYQRAEGAAPGLPGYELWASRELATLGRTLGNSPDAASAWKLAAVAAAAAETRSEEQVNAAYQSSVLAVVQSDAPRAEAKAREIIGLAPNWYKGHLLLSQLLQMSGRKGDEASREADIAKTLGWRPQS